MAKVTLCRKFDAALADRMLVLDGISPNYVAIYLIQLFSTFVNFI